MNSNIPSTHSRKSKSKSFVSDPALTMSNSSSYTVLPDGTLKKKRHKNSYLELYFDKKNYHKKIRKSESQSNSRYSNKYKTNSSIEEDLTLPHTINAKPKEKKSKVFRDFPLKRNLENKKTYDNFAATKQKGKKTIAHPINLEIDLEEKNEKRTLVLSEIQTLTVSNENTKSRKELTESAQNTISKENDINQFEGSNELNNIVRDDKEKTGQFINITNEDVKENDINDKINTISNEFNNAEEPQVSKENDTSSQIKGNPQFIQIKEIDEENDESLKGSQKNMLSSLLRSNNSTKEQKEMGITINDLQKSNISNNFQQSKKSEISTENNLQTFPLKSSLLQNDLEGNKNHSMENEEEQAHFQIEENQKQNENEQNNTQEFDNDNIETKDIKKNYDNNDNDDVKYQEYVIQTNEDNNKEQNDINLNKQELSEENDIEVQDNNEILNAKTEIKNDIINNESQNKINNSIESDGKTKNKNKFINPFKEKKDKKIQTILDDNENNITPIKKSNDNQYIMITQNQNITIESSNFNQVVVQPKNNPIIETRMKNKKSLLNLINSEKDLQDFNLEEIIEKIKHSSKTKKLHSPRDSGSLNKTDIILPEHAYKNYSTSSVNKIKTLITNESKHILKTLQPNKCQDQIKFKRKKKLSLNFCPYSTYELKHFNNKSINNTNNPEYDTDNEDEEYNIGKEYLKKILKKRKVYKLNPNKNFVMPANTLENILQKREERFFSNSQK